MVGSRVDGAIGWQWVSWGVIECVGWVSISYNYPPLRAEPSKAGEIGSRSVWKKKKIFRIYTMSFYRCESHPVVTMDRTGGRRTEEGMEPRQKWSESRWSC